jgi:hypothetical protein
MFRPSAVFADNWFFFEQLILRYPYEQMIKMIVDRYQPYNYLVDSYNEITESSKIHPIKEEDLTKNNSEILDQNISLIRDSMEFYRMISLASDYVSPVLYHYSWHCFNSFLNYSLFTWEQPHANSHGVKISRWDENINDIELQFVKQDKSGIFQRCVETWTLMGTYNPFITHIPIYCEDDKIIFVPNDEYLLRESRSIKLKTLLEYNSGEFEIRLYKKYAKKLINNLSVINWCSLPTNNLINYLIIFVASNIARYRPSLWNKVLRGETKEQSNFALKVRKATIEYTQGYFGGGLLKQVIQYLTEIDQRGLQLQRV